MRSWKDDDNEGTRYMPFKRGKTINISPETDKRLVALIGLDFGTSKHEVLKALLVLAERKAKKRKHRRAKGNRLTLDTERETTPACQGSGGP